MFYRYYTVILSCIVFLSNTEYSMLGISLDNILQLIKVYIGSKYINYCAFSTSEKGLIYLFSIYSQMISI